jgi:primosomal protein N' (replication factor Y)
MMSVDTSTQELGGEVRRTSVLLPLPLSGPYDYRVPEGMTVGPGDFVVAPLGGREVAGVVWGGGSDEVAVERLKPLGERLDVPPLPEVSRRFVDWVANYTLTPPGAVLRMAMSVSSALEPPRSVVAYVHTPDASGNGVRLTPARRRVLDLLKDGPPRTAAEISHEAGVSSSVVRGLATAGWLAEVTLPALAPPATPTESAPGPLLSPDQADAAERLKAAIDHSAFAVALLDGVTGSGKTEVYFEAIAACMARRRQVLVLLPEIALSAEWLDRFRQRFGVPPTTWHSDLTSSERRHAWRWVAEGRARVVVGARSALFLPFPDLGLVVVDEEHDQAYKQEDGPMYQARDMAVVRGRLGNIPVILASATPSLETLANVEAHRYAVCRLPDRHAGASLPEIAAIDLRVDKPPAGKFLAPTLARNVADTVAAGEQVLLFLNRRGYAPLTLCRACGHRLNCPNCSTWLVEHRLAGRLMCHQCGHSERRPQACAACGAADQFAPCGPGVERLAEEVLTLLPETRFAIMASDTVQGPRAAAELIRRIRDHEVDIVIGTQMVAKGHNFPMLTLVGVVDADLGLEGGDLRAAERTYQLLHQVAGRAGRAERSGRVLLQTFQPQHPVMAALVSGDRDRFVAAELAARDRAGMPPFGRLAALIVSGPDPAAVDRVANELGRHRPRDPEIQVFGPAPAPFALLRGRHRRRILAKAPRGTRLQSAIATWIAKVKAPASVRIQVDIDPYSFL